uniref:Uncharacterized protein n=1 Tax=Anguilla anguilla TaxID=7936 RepID=A0A0E9QDR3_ANGAN
MNMFANMWLLQLYMIWVGVGRNIAHLLYFHPLTADVPDRVRK